LKAGNENRVHREKGKSTKKKEIKTPAWISSLQRKPARIWCKREGAPTHPHGYY